MPCTLHECGPSGTRHCFLFRTPTTKAELELSLSFSDFHTHPAQLANPSRPRILQSIGRHLATQPAMVRLSRIKLGKQRRSRAVTLYLVAASRSSEVLPGLPDPIESLGFGHVSLMLTPSFFRTAGHGLRHSPCLSEEIKDRQAYKLKYIHKSPGHSSCRVWLEKTGVRPKAVRFHFHSALSPDQRPWKLRGTPNEDFAQLACRIDTFHVLRFSLNRAGRFPGSATMPSTAFWTSKAPSCVWLRMEAMQSA